MGDFRLLGPVEVWAAGQLIDVGEPRRRAVLAALLMDVGLVVPSTTLIDRVWGDNAPPQARETLATHITRIRRALEQVSNDRDQVAVVHQSGGYRLVVGRDQVDLHRFRRLVDQARTAGCSDEQQVDLLRQAVGLWRGEPLTGLRGDWAHRTREHLVQERLETAAAWAYAEVAVGNPTAVLSSLTELADEHPLMEPLTAVLVQALYAAGRPTQALERLRIHRQLLADEHGTDQGPELRDLYASILRDDPRLPTKVTPRARVSTPAQLPADVASFTGRSDHLTHLDTLLQQAQDHPTAGVITAVSGTAGVGKTALAVHWAHRVADRFPDGQLYVNLRGFDPGGPAVRPSEAIRGFLDALEVPAERIPGDLDAQVGLYRSLLAGKQILVVLDNARDAEQVRPLIPGTPSALTVVTSRNQLTGLVADGAHPVTLDLLPTIECRQLLAGRLGQDRVGAEPAAVDQIISACARLPLALSVVAARARQTGFALSTLAKELAGEHDLLDALDTGDCATRIRTVFSWSYTALTALAARLFRLASLHPGPDITALVAASLTGQPLPQTRQVLVELTQASLLVEQKPGRYAFHDLLRAYAADLTHVEDPDPVRREATTRLVDHYLHTAHNADLLLNPQRDPIPIPLAAPALGTSPEQLTDHQQAMAWLSAELPALLAMTHRALTSGLDTRAWQLTWALDTFLSRTGHCQDLAARWQAALAVGNPTDDPAVPAVAYRLLARADTLLGRPADAHTHLLRSLSLFTEATDPVGQAHVHRQLAFVAQQQGSTGQALQHAGRALTLYRRAGHLSGQAHSLNAVGWYHVLLGHPDRARTCCGQALTMLQDLGDLSGQANAWDSLGYAHHQLGDHAQAADCYQHAIRLYRSLGIRYLEADTLHHLGNTQHSAGNHPEARSSWQQALRILTDLDHPDAATLRTKLES